MGTAMSTPADLKWRNTFVSIKTGHDEAYAAIDQAIKFEEEGKLRDVAALELYKNGINQIDETLKVYVEPPTNNDATWEEALSMVQKLKRARGYVLERINTIKTSPDFIASPSDTSDYEEMTVSSLTYTELANALRDMKMPTTALDNDGNKTEVLFSCKDVAIYNIRSDGVVTSSSSNVSLHILQVKDRDDKIINTSLHIGEWTFPLIPGVSPCLRTSFGAFIIPDLQAEGGALGVVAPPEADAVLLDVLENLLHGIVYQGARTTLEEKLPIVAETTGRDVDGGGFSKMMSYGIVTGAYYVSQGIIKGAQKTGQLLNYVTPRVVSKLQPANSDSMVAVTPGISKGIQVAKDVTGAAVELTGYVSEKVGTATMALGRFLAPHIQKQGARLLSSGLNLSETEAQEKMSGVLTVAAGAVEGFGTIYSGLEQSASILGDNIKNNTVTIVEHSYGSQAGNVVGTGFDTVGNAFIIGKNVSYITPKGLVKKTAKATGKAVVEDYMASDRNNPTSTILYPDLTEFSNEMKIKK